MEVKNTQKISRLLVEAREQDLIAWEWTVDDSRRMEGDEGRFTDLKQYGRVIERAYRRDFWAHQSRRVIVISEKATVAGILRPVLDEFGVPFLAAHGFNSATKVYELAQEIRADRRTHCFLYVGDYDPSGMHMSEMDLPGRLRRYGAARLSAAKDRTDQNRRRHNGRHQFSGQTNRPALHLVHPELWRERLGA